MEPREPKTLGGWIVANLILLGGMALFAVWAFPNLPERYPIHFDMHGHPNGWAAGGSKEWFLILGIDTLINLMFIGIALAMRKMPPRMINLPDKQKFLELPTETQQDFITSFAQMILVMGLIMNVLLTAVYVMLYQVALQRMAPPSGMPTIVVPVLITLFPLIWTLKVVRQIRRTCDENQERKRALDRVRPRD